MYENIATKLDVLQISLFELQSLSYIEEIYREINHAIDSNKTPSSLIDAGKLEVYFRDFRGRVEAKGYTVLQNFEELFMMDCHMLFSKEGMMTINYITKVVEKASEMQIYRYLSTPIKVQITPEKDFYLKIKNIRRYLIVDNSSNLSKSISENFYENCILSNEFKNQVCNIALTNFKTSCLGSLLFAKNSLYDYIEKNCAFEILGRSSLDVSIISNTDAYLFTGQRTKIYAACANYQSDRYLPEGITKSSLIKPTKCTFEGKHIHFSLQSNKEPINVSEFFVNISNIDTSGKFLRKLNIIESSGINTNDTKSFHLLNSEISSLQSENTSITHVSYGAVTLFGIIAAIGLAIFAYWRVKTVLANRKFNAQIQQINKDGK